MKSQRLFPLCLVSAGLALSASLALADDTPPPAAPAAPQTTPSDGEQPTPTPAPHHRHGHGNMLEELTQKLGLTADQQKKVGDLLKSEQDQARSIRDDDSLSDDDRRAKMKDLRTSTRSQIRAVLTPDQQKIFDTLPARGDRQRNTDAN